MKRYLNVVAGVFLTLTYLADAADAASDSCAVEERDLARAERASVSAETRLSQSEDRLARLQDQIAFRQLSYQTQITQAEANASVISATSGGVATQCVIRALFGYRFGSCASRSIASRIGSQARARAMVNTAITRSNAYNTYAQGALYREGLRVTKAQDEYSSKTALYQVAQQAYEQCRATPKS
jgi:hypothetical protein